MTLPDHIDGYGPVQAFAAVDARTVAKSMGAGRGSETTPRRGSSEKLRETLRAAILETGLRNGGTISFHHHLRDGDDVLRRVMAELADLGFKGLRVAASSIFPAHACLVDYIRSGVVDRIVSSYITGPVAEAISAGALPTPAVLQTHGGRAWAIESGVLAIDVAFVAAPAADSGGNLNGVDGKSACGPLGYPMVDVRFAGHVVAVTDTLLDYPLSRIDIAQDLVDLVVVVDTIGDPARIVSGTTRVTEDPDGLAIARLAAEVIDASGLLIDGFSFQTGAGGISLAVADSVADLMRRRGIVGGFAAGGITQGIVSMFREGLFRVLFDVQCFDLAAVASYRDDVGHLPMSASLYASPGGKGAVVDRLDVMILGAAEIDTRFDVNVTAVGGGRIIGGSGGHADTAAGAKLAIVTTKLASRDNPKIVDRVECISTPGESIDVVVTEAGIAVNPRRKDLIEVLGRAGLPLVSIETLRRLSAQAAGRDGPACRPQGRIVAVVEYRDGSVIDLVRQPLAG
ncbi:citrate lyase subunit alpha [Brevundimonas bullata]|uniref:citrate lyase subunit alpha n=1 Tax=Brevundimonas bullata TaxID=13160 RepID=UPI003D9A9232